MNIPGIAGLLNHESALVAAFRPGPTSCPGLKGGKPRGCQPLAKMLFHSSGTATLMTPVSSWITWKVGMVVGPGRGVGDRDETTCGVGAELVPDSRTPMVVARIAPTTPINAAMICSDRLNLPRSPRAFPGSFLLPGESLPPTLGLQNLILASLPTRDLAAWRPELFQVKSYACGHRMFHYPHNLGTFGTNDGVKPFR